MSERGHTRRERNLLLAECLVASGALLACFLWFAPAPAVDAAAPELVPARAQIARELELGERTVLAIRAPVDDVEPARTKAPPDERAAATVAELAAELRAEHFDLATWDRDARAGARRLGPDSRPAIAALLESGTGELEERLSTAELALLLSDPAESDPAALPPAVEAELFQTILAHASRPRLAAAAARAHAALGGAAALRFWVDAASGLEDPGLAALAIRALGAVQGERAASAVASALEASTDELARERLVIVLGNLAPAGASASDGGASSHCRRTLIAIVEDDAAGPTLRRRARNALAEWEGAPRPEPRAMPDDVFVLQADPERVSRAIDDSSDFSRAPAQRRRAASVLAEQGADAETALCRVLLHDPDAEVRSAAAVALGRGAFDADARQVLEQASQTDPSPAVRRQATQVLANE